MIRLFGVGTVLAAVAIAPSAVAQLPMSPVYRTETERPPSKADETGPTAKDTAPAERPAEEHASPEKPEAVGQKPVATAPIPPLPSRDAGDGDGLRPGMGSSTHLGHGGYNPAAPVRLDLPGNRCRRAAVPRGGNRGDAEAGASARSSGGCRESAGRSSRRDIIRGADQSRGPERPAASPDQMACPADRLPLIITNRRPIMPARRIPTRPAAMAAARTDPRPILPRVLELIPRKLLFP